MAGGNLGDLWFQLGVKDNTSKELQKIIDKLKTGDDAANSLLRALQGFGTKKSGFKEQAEKAKEFADVLNEINRRISKLKKNDKSDEAKDLQMAVKNALSYLDMLQRINIERSKISELRSLNPNVDTSKLKEAELMLENVNNQLYRLQNKAQGGGGGGVDYANVLQDYAKVLQMTFRDVKQITDQFKKENPLSAFSGGAAKVEADISRVTEKLAKMRDLMAEGALKGYNTNMLGGSITELDKILARLQAASGNKSILTDAAQMKNLLSDVAVEMTKAVAATQAYGREKGKVIALEREHERAINKFNSIQTGENQKKKALADIEILLKNIDALSSRGIGLGQDVSKLESVRSEIERIKEDIRSISGKGLTGQEFKNALANLSEYKTRAHDIMKDQRDMNSAAIGQLNFRKQIESTIQNLNNQRAAFEKNSSVVAKFRSDIDALNKFNETVLYSKGLGGDKILSDKIASETKKLEEYKQTLEGLNKELEKNLAIQRETQSKLHSISPGVDGRNMNGKALTGPLLEEYNRLLSKLESGKGIIETYKNWSIDSQKDQISAQEAYVNRLKELQKEASRLDSVNPSDLKDKLIQKNKELLQSEKEYSKQLKDNAKQRQKEIDASLNRIQALKYALQNLWGKRQEAKSLNIDTTKVDAKIQETIGKIRFLEENLAKLRGDKYAESLGKIGGIGSGREVRSISHLASEQAKVNREVQRGVELEQKRQQEIAQSAAKARNDLAAAFAGANAEAKKMQSIVGDIKSIFLQGGIVFGAQQFFNSIVQTGGEIVQQHVALRSILGDVQKADELFAQTQQLALQSPFKFGELNRDVKQLAAFGVEANDLYDTTKRLADIASGLGVSFERLGLAYGQVKARSWLDGKELRQFAYAGLPLLQRITELYNSEGKNGRNNYTKADVKKMISARQVSFEDVQKVLWKMTDEGGQFYNMQFVLSETLLGRWNKLIDAWDIMLGKFAEGKNVVGGTFSFLINRTTDLILALDKVSNAALAFGAMYALRKGATAIASRVGISSNLAALQAERQVKLRTFAVEQQQALIEGKITLEKMRQNIADYQGMLNSKINTRNAVEQAALEGRLSALKMQKAFREGLISKEMIEQLRLMGMISAKESELITKEGTRARMSLAVNQAKGKLGGFFSGWNIATLGITIGTALYSAYSQFKDSIKQDTDRINETAKTTVKTLSDTLSEVGNKGTGETLQQQVDKMTDVLKQSGLYTDSIKEQIDSTDDLGKEYDILKQKIIDARNENNFTPSEGENFAKAKKATGAGFAGEAGWFGQWTGIGQDDIDKNINDVAGNLAQLQMKMEKFGDSTKSSMEKVANSILGARSAGMTFEEKIAEICSSRGVNGYWETFVKKVSNGNKDVEDDLRGLEGDLDDFSGNFGQIATDDIPKYLEYMAKSRNMDMVEFSRWCKQHPDKFRTMLDQMLSEANKKVPGLVARLQSVAMAILNIGKAKPQEGNTGPKVWKNPNKVGTIERKAFDKQQKAGRLKGGTDGFWQKEMAEYLHNLNGGNSNGWTSFGEAVRKRYKEVRDENDNAKNAGDRQPYVREQRMLEAIAAQSGISLDVGKNKVTGHFGKGKNKNGREEDKQLKNLRERIDLYKKMYAEIKKFKELYGEGALGQLANDGEFEAIFGDKKRFPISDYTNYETSIKELLRTLPATTKDRLDYVAKEKAGIQTENRKLLEDQRRDELNVLNKQLDVISEQYDTYKKIYELTGNNKGSENLAFGGTIQFDTYKRFLEEQLDVAVKHDNVQSDLNLTTGEVKGMSLENVKDKYGEESRVYDIRKKLEDENNKIKKETIDLMASLIEKNATIAQQIEDENRKYERQLELIKGIEDPQMRDRAKAGATKTHNENVAKLQFEQFKQESDWVTIFDDLDRVSSATISSMITKIDDFSRTTGLSVEVVKQLRDALDKLRKEDIDRNPLPYIFGAVNQGNAIGGYLKGNLGVQYMNGKKYVPTAEQAKKMGIEWSAAGYSKDELASKQKGKYADSSNAINALAGKFKALESALDPVIGLFKAMGEEDSILGQITGGASNAVSSAANTVGAFNTLSTVKGLGFLEGAGPYAAAASAAFSIGGSLIKAFGADYSSYNKAKAEYENLTSIWDSLISKKTEYMNIHWGTEAANASKEAQEMLESEIKQTKVIAMKNFNSGASAGSHSIKVRDWEKRGWKEAAPEISKRYGVKFDSMTDILDIDYKVLQQIKKDYAELWANLDEDSRTYLDKLIEYGEKSEDMIESLTEKLTGNKYSDLVSAWGDAMATMSNTSDNLVDHFEENLRNVILKSMIENLYGEKIKALIEKTKKYGDPNGGTEKKLDTATGKVMSEYTNTEMDEIGKDLADVTKQIEASRDYLKRYYGWSDNSSSSLTNSVKGITEETGDLIASYLNSIRLDVSVIREEQVKCMSESNEIAKSQLTQLNFISANTLRNAEAAERIERVFEEYSSNFNMVINGVKSIKVR